MNTKPRLYFLALLFSVTLILAFFILKPFIYPLILALVLAVVVQPVFRRFRVLAGGRVWLASILTILIVIVFVITPLLVVGWQIFQESQQLYFSISGGWLSDDGGAFRADWLGRWPWLANLSFDFEEYLRTGLNFLSQHLGVIFSSLAKGLISFFVFLISFFYLLKDGDKFKKRLVALSPLTKEDDDVIAAKITGAVNSVVKGSLTIAILQGLISSLGLALFGVPNPVLWGALATIGALIPGVGTALVLVPAVLYLYLIGPLWPAVGLLLWASLAVGLIDNLLGPKLIGRGAKLHPLLTLLSVLGGLSLFGPIGFILGPLTTVFLLVLLELYLTPQSL